MAVSFNERSRFFLLYSFLIFFKLYSFGQKLTVVSNEDNIPLPNCNIYSENLALGQTDSLGNFLFDKKYKNLKITHVGFKTEFIKSISNDTIIQLQYEEYNLKEIKIEYLKEKKIESLLNKLYVGETNFSFREHAIVLINNEHKALNSILIEIIDVFGVKNIKYRPFRLNIFEFDTLTNSLGRKVFESEILKKTNSKKYYTYFFEDNLKIKTDRFYVSFEILNSNHYKPDFIESEVGFIAAVPSIKLRSRKFKNSFKALFDDSNNLIYLKEIIYGDLNIKIKYEND